MLFALLLQAAAWAGNGKETVEQVTDEVALMTDMDYVITGTEPFATGGSVNIINTEHAVIIFKNIKPSVVINKHLGGVLVNGEKARNGVNCQVKMYAQGAIVLPYSKDFKPLTVYSEPNFEGEAVNDFGLENTGGFMNTLSDAKLNNRIRSFKLKRGYMVTFALGTGGWGYSRCFIADQEDLEVAVMPSNMDGRISSYRVFQWQNAQKKGLASDTRAEANGALNASWCYTWSAGENRLPDTECVPNHIYEDWPSPAECGRVTYSCHMKTNNEPGNSADDHPQDVQTVLNNWQNLMRTGLRLCSETSHDGSWNHLREFISQIDARGWRCDLLDLHCYWASGSFWGLEGYYNDYGKRPIWISEFVWGASWNKNGIFGEAPDGKDSFSTANQQKNYSGMRPILDFLNSLGCVERYAYWNSEADCSKIYRNGELIHNLQPYWTEETGATLVDKVEGGDPITLTRRGSGAFVPVEDPRPPSGAKRLEWIQGDGNGAYFATDFVPDPTRDKMEVVVTPTKVDRNQFVFGARSGNASKDQPAWALQLRGSTGFRYDFNTISGITQSGELVKDVKYTFTADANKLTWSHGEGITSTENLFSAASGPLKILYAEKATTYTTCKLHSFRIWRDGKLIHEFLPARLPSGVLNLVDYGPDPIPVTRNGLFQAGPELPPKSGLIILFRGR